MNDFEQILRETLQRKADGIRPDPAGAARVFRRSRRARVVTMFSGSVAAAAIVALVFAAASAWRSESNPIQPGPGIPSASLSPIAAPDPCLRDGPNPNGECGWLFDADLDGDGERDLVTLIVSLDEKGLVPESAELYAALASGSTATVAVEVDRFAGFPQPVPDLFWPDGGAPGVLDLDGDGRDEVMLSLFQSVAGRVFVRLFVWEDDGLSEVTAVGESGRSPRRLAFELEGTMPGRTAPFEFILGGSAGFGGGMRCADVDGDPERELILRFYWYAANAAFYEIHQAVYELDGATATQASIDSKTVPVDAIDDSFRNVDCENRRSNPS